MSSSNARKASLALLTAFFAVVTASTLYGQERTPRNYLSVLGNARPATLDDGRVVISMDVTGDLRGLLTLTLSPDGSTGTWALMSSYVQDLRSDGSEIAPTDHATHDHTDSPGTPETHREYAVFKFDGTLSGTVEAATVREAEDGRVYAVETATLIVARGTALFDGVNGSGRIGAWPTEPGAITLLLNF